MPRFLERSEVSPLKAYGFVILEVGVARCEGYACSVQRRLVLSQRTMFMLAVSHPSIGQKMGSSLLHLYRRIECVI